MTDPLAILLLVAVFLPTAAAMVSDGRRQWIRLSALAATVLDLVLVAVLVASFPGGGEVTARRGSPDPAGGLTEGLPEFAVSDFSWFGQTPAAVDIRFSIGLDGLSIWLVGLTALLMVVAVLVSWETIDKHASAYYRLLLLLETGMLGVFVARDIILFYVFFEFTLIPLFFLIGVWGSEERRYAAIKFFLFTLAGSLLTFLGLVALAVLNYRNTGVLTFSIPGISESLATHPIDPVIQVVIFLALFAGFAIKVPLFPLHTWLPLAHVQAPTAGSVILAGVLLKVGTYGFVRFSLPMLPDAAALCMPWLLWLSVAGVIYGALVALAQKDIKRLIAYSSVSHLGFCMLGIFALNRLGVQGGVLQMINHGLSTGGLFALVGMLYERYHTREIQELGGLARRTPILAFFFVFMTFSSIAVPGLNGFAGEFLLLLGVFQLGWADAPAGWAAHYRVISVLAVTGVILGAWYMLWLVQRVFFGPLREPKPHGKVGPSADQSPVRDLSMREILALAPLCIFIVWIGVQPSFFLDKMSPTLDPIADRGARALESPALAREGSGFPAEGSGFRVQGSGFRGDSSLELGGHSVGTGDRDWFRVPRGEFRGQGSPGRVQDFGATVVLSGTVECSPLGTAVAPPPSALRLPPSLRVQGFWATVRSSGTVECSPPATRHRPPATCHCPQPTAYGLRTQSIHD